MGYEQVSNFIATILTRKQTYLAQVSLEEVVEMMVRLVAYGLLPRQEVSSHLSLPSTSQ